MVNLVRTRPTTVFRISQRVPSVPQTWMDNMWANCFLSELVLFIYLFFVIEVEGSVNIDLDRNCRGCYTPRISLSLSLLMLFESRGQCSINASRGLSKASFLDASTNVELQFWVLIMTFLCHLLAFWIILLERKLRIFVMEEKIFFY